MYAETETSGYHGAIPLCLGFITKTHQPGKQGCRNRITTADPKGTLTVKGSQKIQVAHKFPGVLCRDFSALKQLLEIRSRHCE